MGFTLSLLILTPIYIIAVFDCQPYFGYIGITTYHNPTIILLKPIALLHFLCTMKAFDNHQCRKRLITLTAILTILSVIAKPSYVICLLPSLTIFIVFKQATKQTINWRLLLAGIVLPSVAILTWQYGFTYSASEKHSIVFSPFKVMSHYSEYLFLKFILSILFPLCVYALYFKKAIRDHRLNLSWLVFFSGAFYSYFLCESGPRMFDGNFLWSGQISLFILFVVSILFVIKRKIVYTGFYGRDLRLLAFVFGTHVTMGMLFYVAQYWMGRTWL